MPPYPLPLLIKELPGEITATLTKDPEPPNPRDGDQIASIAAWHPTFPLSDRPDLPNPTSLLQEIHASITLDTPDTRDPAPPTITIVCQNIQDHYQGLILKLSIIQDPFFTFHTAPFDHSWDHNQAGYVYITPQTLADYTLSLDRARAVIQRELRAYEDYLNGRVYTLTVSKAGHPLDSLPGIYRHHDQPRPAPGLPAPTFLDGWLIIMDIPGLSPSLIYDAPWHTPPPESQTVTTQPAKDS